MANVRHFLADGREVDSIDGYVVPASGPTERLYWFLIERWEKQEREKQKKEQERKEQQNG